MPARLYQYKDHFGIRYKIRFRVNGKSSTRRLFPGTRKTEAGLILSKYNHNLSLYKNKISPWIDPLYDKFSDSEFTVRSFREWFFEHKIIAKRRGRKIDPRTLHSYDYAFRNLENVVGPGLQLYALCNNEVRTRFEKYISDKYSPNSQSIIVRSLRSAWNLGIEKEIIDKINPFNKIPITEESKDIGYWTREEIESIFNQIENEEAKKGFILAWLAGLRKVEICRNVSWENIFWDSGYGIIPVAKTAYEQTFYLFPDLIKKLHPYKQEQGFICSTHYTNLSHLVTAARIKANVRKKGSVKMLRHSFAHHLLTKTGDLRFVQRVMRHSSSKTTEIYTKLSDRELIDKIKSISLTQQ